MADTMLEVGVAPERISLAIQESGMPAMRVARQMGVSPGALNGWTTGERMPTVVNLHRLAQVTGKSVAWFFNEDAIPPRIQQDAELGRRVRMVLADLHPAIAAALTGMSSREAEAASDLLPQAA